MNEYGERFVPGDGVTIPDEWQPVAWDEEPEGWWDELQHLSPVEEE